MSLIMNNCFKVNKMSSYPPLRPTCYAYIYIFIFIKVCQSSAFQTIDMLDINEFLDIL